MSITQDTYLERAKQLGLDPKLHAGGNIPVVLPVHGVEKVRQLLGSYGAANPPRSSLSAQEVASAPNIKARTAIVGHVLNQTLLSEEAQGAIDERFPFIPLHVYLAPDIVITAANPLIISSASAVTNFGVVTIKDGGYIDISTDCQFVCDQLIKIPGGSSPADADIVVHGKDGVSGLSPDTKSQANKGDDGSGASCDCCGGTVAHHASPGGNGADGLDGKGAGDGEHAVKFGPNVTILINKLSSTVSIAQRGGTGGNGGDGAHGQQGGNGGKGGDGTTCGAYKPDGAKGGTGGAGGGGGASGSGGNAGSGGQLSVHYSPETASNRVIASNSSSYGGRKGHPGSGGSGGMGGAGGDRGGSQGGNGSKGAGGSDLGMNGQDGERGVFLVNGEPVN